MNPVSKTFYLPSGGFNYPPIVLIKDLDMEYIFYLLDQDKIDSSFDLMQSIINHFCILPTSILNMYTSDIYYLYSYILITENRKDNYFIKATKCARCGEEHKISFFIGNFQTTVYNPYKPLTLNNIFKSTDKTVELELNIRTVLDNITYSNLLVQEETELAVIDYYSLIALFILTQTKRIKYNGEEVKKEHWHTIISSLLLKDLLSLHNMAIDINKTFGIYDKVKYNCSKCKVTNIFWYYDDIIESKFIINKVSNINDKEKLIKYLISQSRLPCFSMEDLVTRPLKLEETFNNVVKATKFQSGAVMF